MSTSSFENVSLNPFVSMAMDRRIVNMRLVGHLIEPLANALVRAGKGEIFDTKTSEGTVSEMRFYVLTVPRRTLCVQFTEFYRFQSETLVTMLTYDYTFNAEYDPRNNTWMIKLFDK